MNITSKKGKEQPERRLNRPPGAMRKTAGLSHSGIAFANIEKL